MVEGITDKGEKLTLLFQLSVFNRLLVFVATDGPLYSAILSGFGSDDIVSCDFILLPTYTKLLAAGGTLIAKTELGTEDALMKRMKLCGFLNVVKSESVPGVVVGNMPTYKVDT